MQTTPRLTGGMADEVPWLQATADGWRLLVRVQPGASRSGIVGPYGDRLKVRVAAPATDGKANAELVRFLASTVGVPGRDVRITHGETSRSKTVELPRTATVEALAPRG